MSKRKLTFVNSGFIAVLAAFLFIGAGPARAEGHGPGNGGNAVAVGGKLYLLDLVEAGVEKAPYIRDLEKFKVCSDSGCTGRALTSRDRRFLERAERDLVRDSLDSDTNRLLALKLLSLKSLVREEFLIGINLYQWRITDLPLEEVKGIKSPLDLSRTAVYQLAYRRDSAIMINRALWDRLDRANRVALVIHELVYAMLRPTPNGDGTFTQESWDARLIVGNLFTEATADRSLNTYVRNGIPLLSIFEEKETDWRYQYVLDILNAYTTQSFGEVMYNPGVEVIGADDPTKTLDTEFRSIGAWSIPGVDSAFEHGNACDELEKHGNRGIVRNVFVRAHMEFVDYKTDAGFTKALDVKYTTKSAGICGSRDASGQPVCKPFQSEVAYASIGECRAKYPSEASSVARNLDAYYDLTPEPLLSGHGR